MSTLLGTSVVRLILIGALAGLFSGFFGVGGGFIMVPLLLAVARFDQHRAHATSLAAIVLIAIAAVIRFGVGGEVDIVTGLLLGAGGMVGSTLGAGWMNRLPAATLRVIFIVILLVAGVGLAFGGEPTSVFEPESLLRAILAFAIGAIAGLASGLAGIGGGVVMVPAMVFLLGMTQHSAEGTSLLAICFTALAGTRVNLKHNRVRLADAGMVALAGLIASPLGATLALRLSGADLSRAFGVFVLVIGARMLYATLRERRQRS
ncbi:MAG TPA: sulfite exporter TauE/SafE family protein [Acidimicrobiia bacterium]